MAARPGTAVCTDGCAGGTCTGGHARTFVPATIIAATAPAVANPYTHSAHGTVADMGGAAGVAVGDVVAPDDATSATAGVAPEGDTPPAGSLVRGAHGHSLPSTFTRQSYTRQTRDCSGSPLQIGGSLESLATQSISTMEPILMVGLVPLRMQSGSGFTTRRRLLPATVRSPQWPLGSPFSDDADQPLGWSHSVALELGAAIGIPGDHPPPRPRDHSIP